MCDQCVEETPIDLFEPLTVPLNYVIKPKIKNLAEIIEDADKELEICEQQIKLSIKHSEKSFLTIGENLCKIRDEKLYKRVDGILYFTQYLLQELDMSSRTAQRFMQIWEFTKTADIGGCDKYSLSQLDELVSIKPEDKDLFFRITPSMSVAKIRTIKQNYYHSKQNQAIVNALVNEKPKKEQSKPEPVAEQKSSFEDIYNSTMKIVESNEIKPLILKNKNERLDFLKSYAEWDLVAQINYLRLKVYCRKLKNHTAIIAMVSSDIQSKPLCVKYAMFQEPENKTDYGYQFPTKYFNLWFNSENVIVDYLTSVKKEIE